MRTYNILNLGAGVQSTTLYLMSHRQDEPELVPRFNCAIFADTQEESDEVYRHLEWLESLEGPPILTVTAGKLGNDLISGKGRTFENEGRFASIPAFMSSGTELEALGKRQCTKDYKVTPIEQAIKRDILKLAPRCRLPKDVRIVQYFGLSFDEPRRIIRVQGRYQDQEQWACKFPLFDLQMKRGDCKAYLRETAPGRPVPRSACVFCPYHSNDEWRRIRDNDPKGWARAIEIDDALRVGARCAKGLDKSLYIHRSCVPLRDAMIDTPESLGHQKLLFDNECEGMCGL